jgi:hypothetical protein
MGKGPPFKTFIPQLGNHWGIAPLEADLGNQTLPFCHRRKGPGLMDGQGQGFFDVQVKPLLEAPHPYIVHNVGLANDHRRIRLELSYHLLIIEHTPCAVTVFYAVLVRCGFEPFKINIADPGYLNLSLFLQIIK